MRTAAETLRANPALDTETAITELGVGEALVSCLDAKGTPAVVERAWMLPPASRIGPLTPEERESRVAASVIRGHYEKTVDRESAHETLKARTMARQAAEQAAAPEGRRPLPGTGPASTSRPAPSSGGLSDILFGTTGPRGGRREGVLESAARSAARSVGSGMGREILRGVLGSIFGGKRR